MYHTSTSVYVPYFVQIIFMDGHTDGRTAIEPALLGRLKEVDLNMYSLTQ